MIRVLVACECSGTVRDAFLAKGHDAWSCDLKANPSDRHIQGDALDIISEGWDLVIAHPPCTHLAVSGAKHFETKRGPIQEEAIRFFMDIVDHCDLYADHWCIENPIGIMSDHYRKPDQIIQPWMFGHSVCKSTCLWLHELLPLQATNIVDKGEFYVSPKGQRFSKSLCHGTANNRGARRSVTYEGIARAMANQWP